MPERSPARTESDPCRARGLTRPRRRTHHLDLPHMRSDGVRAAAQHPLQMPRRDRHGADLQRHVKIDETHSALERYELRRAVEDHQLDRNYPTNVGVVFAHTVGASPRLRNDLPPPRLRRTRPRARALAVFSGRALGDIGARDTGPGGLLTFGEWKPDRKGP